MTTAFGSLSGRHRTRAKLSNMASLVPPLSWLTAPSVQVVTVDALNMNAIQLQREVLRLRTRIQKLIALLRVLLVVLKISRFSLNQTRLPDDHDKRSLLRVSDRARSALPLRSALRVIQLSPSRYRHWNREEQCALGDRPSCPRVSPLSLPIIPPALTDKALRPLPPRVRRAVKMAHFLISRVRKWAFSKRV